MCARCEELEEEAAYLRSELGGAVADGAIETLRRALQSGRKGVSRPRVAAMLLALYRAHGRPVSKVRMLEEIPPKAGGEDDRDPKMVDVWVCQARAALGFNVIETVWGNGYRLSSYGLDLVGRYLGEISPIPAAQALEDRSPEELRSMAALIAGLLAHKDADGGLQTAKTYRRIADRLTGRPRIAA